MIGRPAYVGEGGDGEGPAVGEPVRAAEGVQYSTLQYSTVQYLQRVSSPRVSRHRR